MSGPVNRCLCITIPMVATVTYCKLLPLSLVNLLEAVTIFLLVQVWCSGGILFGATTCGSLQANN